MTAATAKSRRSKASVKDLVPAFRPYAANRPSRGARRPLTCLALAACTGGFTQHYQRGYVLPEGALEQIPIGSTQEQVLLVLGTPSTVATVSGEAFYYISQRAQQTVAFVPQRVTDQRVIAVYFDKNRRVERLAITASRTARCSTTSAAPRRPAARNWAIWATCSISCRG